MIEIIFLIVLFSSLTGIAVIIYQKLPLIPETIESSSNSFNWKNSLNKFKERKFIKNFSIEKFFQKILSKTRILILKIENKISNVLQKLREKAKKKKSKEAEEKESFLVKNRKNDNYWQEVKKFKKKKNLN